MLRSGSSRATMAAQWGSMELRAAKNSEDQECSSVRPGSAPAPSSTSMVSECPLMIAFMRGLRPSSSRLSTSAPLETNASTVWPWEKHGLI
jgi:hypothetical protein